jgi:hypothetical protein
MIQVDVLCHKIPNFIEKSRRAGVTKVFIGLENINPDNLAAAKKKQNKITEYRKMLLAWKRQGILTFAGYILGLPADTPASIERDIGIIQRELPIDFLEFMCLTPLPGSEDHQTLWKSGIAMDPDLNKYDVEHACAAHPKMTADEWQKAYRTAWRLYYSREHQVTLLRRGMAMGAPMLNLAKYLLTFSTTDWLERVHPLQGGILRLKHPSERRPGLAPESAMTFWPQFIWETIRKHAILVREAVRLLRLVRAIKRDPASRAYADIALTPVDDETSLALLTETSGVEAAMAHAKKIAELTGAHA